MQQKLQIYWPLLSRTLFGSPFFSAKQGILLGNYQKALQEVLG